MRFRNEFGIAIIEKPLKTNAEAFVWVLRVGGGAYAGYGGAKRVFTK
jgi:hypothetical protein